MKSHKIWFWMAVLLAAVLFLAGAAVLAIPTANRLRHEAKSGSVVEQFMNRYHSEIQTDEQDPALPEVEHAQEQEQKTVIYPELLDAMQAYNDEIYQSRQSGLQDPWCYTAPVIDLKAYGLAEEAVGVLTIPKMDYREPVYLGATAEHLDSGAAQLSISSMPIGGINTNCVLAGHRGWEGALHLQYIDLLEPGDAVTLYNLWERLEYRVVEIKIIEPYQAEELLIREGRDLLTLVTCHPYGSGGRYRYVVYCERKK